MSAGRRTAAGRRLRLGAMTTVLLAAATVSLVIVNALAARYDARLDVTALREHRLSPRSETLLKGLESGYEVVVAAPLRDRRIVDPRALEPLRDVMEQFNHAGGGGKVRGTIIDTGSAAGLDQYRDLLKRLAERDRGAIEARVSSLSKLLADSGELAGAVEALSPRLQAVRDAIPEDTQAGVTNRSYFDQRAAELRVIGPALREAVGKSQAAMAAPSGPLPVPDLDAAAAPVVRVLAEVEAGVGDIAESARRLAAADGLPAAARDAARAASQAAGPLRDRAAVLRDGLEHGAKIDLLRVARTLQGTTAALVIGPSGVTAIELTRLLPAPAVIDATGGAKADFGRNAEELIATALASLAQPIKPIVVFVHGQPARGLLQSPDFQGLLERLALRGIDGAEWAASVDPDPPPLTKADPTGKRPVVYAVLSTDASQSVQGKGQSGPERAAKLGKALGRVLDGGNAVLLSLNPSTLPTFGEVDPMTTPLAAFGLAPDTGRPLLKERFAADGRHVDAFQSLVAKDVDHPIAKALRGLPLRLEWPVAVKAAGNATGQGSVIYAVVDAATWGESQWLSYWQVKIQEHDLVPNKPAKDSQRDDASGPWPVVVATQRGSPAGGTQRLVVVGSNTWFMDRIAEERMVVDGRPVPTNPGNAELFEASVYWLAGQDEMIAQSPAARAVPLIAPLGGGTLLVLRWSAILGLPGLVLLTGAVWRLIRG